MLTIFYFRHFIASNFGLNLKWSEKDHSDFLAECDCLFELGQIQELINNLKNHIESKDPDIQEWISKRENYDFVWLKIR